MVAFPGDEGASEPCARPGERGDIRCNPFRISSLRSCGVSIREDRNDPLVALAPL
jgi:hypothetical protein